MRKVPVSLLVQILEHFLAEPELIRDTAIPWCIRLTHLLRHVSVREVLGRRGVNLPLGTTRFLVPPDDRDRR